MLKSMQLIDDLSLTPSLQSLAHQWPISSLSPFYSYRFGLQSSVFEICLSNYSSRNLFSPFSCTDIQSTLSGLCYSMSHFLYLNLFPLQNFQTMEHCPTFHIPRAHTRTHTATANHFSRTGSINWFLRECSPHFPTTVCLRTMGFTPPPPRVHILCFILRVIKYWSFRFRPTLIRPRSFVATAN